LLRGVFDVLEQVEQGHVRALVCQGPGDGQADAARSPVMTAVLPLRLVFIGSPCVVILGRMCV
jgi:hypothetical protein